MRKYVFVLLLSVISGAVLAQENIFNSQYLLNKRKYNPAYVSPGSVSLLGVSYRGQWGNENAPSLGELYGQHLLSEKFVIGGQLGYGESILLKELNALISSTYIVPINKNHRLNFGLAAGVLQSRIDLTDVNYDSNDRLLMDMESTIYPDLKFGINYSYKSLNIGISLPHLFKTQSFSYDSLDIVFNNFDISFLNELLIIAEYKFDNISKDISLSPYALYHKSNTLYLGDYIEGGLMINYRNIMQLGATYSTYNLITGILCIDVSKKLRFNYAYEIPVGDVKTAYANTHEFGLVMKFGNQNKIEKSPINEQYDIIHNTQNMAYEMDERSSYTGDYSGLRLEVVQIDSYSGPSPDFFEIVKGIYILFGQFNKNKQAEKHKNSLLQKGFNTDIRFSSISNNYYHILDKKFDSIAEAESYFMGDNRGSDDNYKILVVQ